MFALNVVLMTFDRLLWCNLKIDAYSSKNIAGCSFKKNHIFAFNVRKVNDVKVNKLWQAFFLSFFLNLISMQDFCIQPLMGTKLNT